HAVECFRAERWSWSQAAENRDKGNHKGSSPNPPALQEIPTGVERNSAIRQGFAPMMVLQIRLEG
ncbi:MAG: hypothetical protein KDE58_08970, partial [Caldilineaceae bacterium]|nr:hypothetical protein [Caldilineaceae bacterium]